MDETMKTKKEEIMRKSAPCLPEPYGGAWERPVREVSLNRNMIHSERVGAERKEITEGERERAGAIIREGKKKTQQQMGGRKGKYLS